MHRRGFNYDDGPSATHPNHDADTAHDHTKHRHNYDAGLLFAAYVRDPATQFVPAQQAMSTHDRMARFTTPVGSGLWAVPPGVKPGGYVGQPLLD